MIAAVAALVFASSLSGDPCRGVVDATSTCASPAHVDTTAAVKADAKADAPPPSFDPTKLSGEFAFLAVGLALGGGAALAVSFANNPRTDDEVTLRTVGQIGGVSLLASSVLVASSAVALSMFDPSTGEFRLKKLFEGSD